MVSPDGASSHVGEVLAGHHRNCTIALARLQLLIGGEHNSTLRDGAVHEVEHAMRQVLDEVLAAEGQVLATLSGTSRVKPATQLLGGRLERLHDAAEHVGAAVRAGNISWLRRYLTRFDALTKATLAIQLDVYTSVLTSARAPLRAKPPASQSGHRVAPSPT